VPVDVLKLWIDESYRALAPKRLVAQLEAEARPLRRRRGSTAQKRASRR